MKFHAVWITGLVIFTAAAPNSYGQREFGFVNTRPSGQPYLSPEESIKRFKVPPGWEVKVFAAEPDVINPISFTVDERGRIWVVECFEYPRRTPPGQKPRDRIKILEDRDGDGRADSVTLWAEGKDLPHFDLASGIEVGYGGAFVGAAPYLLFLKDSGGSKFDGCTILLEGFGSQDTHETLNTLQWGPDGRLHGLHGIFTHSKVGPVELNAAVWRYHVRQKRFDIFAEGTSNPWGLDFDAHGQAFLTACVIPHCFHMIPGGSYIRQAGASFNPYTYGLLNEISDHRHHQESGWAHAGALVLQGDHIPAEYRDSLLMGSIHGTSIKRDVLARRGSTFVARHAPDFLASDDKNFRPINMRWAHDGAIYVIDWHDQNPCHQAAPDSWDKAHGRIYKIQRSGSKPRPPENLALKSTKELVQTLTSNNAWRYKTALRLLSERGDKSVVRDLEELLFTSTDTAHALRGLWGLQAIEALDEAKTLHALAHANPWVRSWAARLAGDSGGLSPTIVDRLVELAPGEESPEVRLQFAATAQRLAGTKSLRLLHALMTHAADVDDPCIPLMIWLAYERHVARQRDDCLAWLQHSAAGNALVREAIVPRTLRRLAATGDAEALKAALDFLVAAGSAIRRQGLAGLLEGLGTGNMRPPENWQAGFNKLVQDSNVEVQRLARRLALKMRDAQAILRALEIVRNRSNPLADRLEAVRDLAAFPSTSTREAFLHLLGNDPSEQLRVESLRALAGFDDRAIASTIVAKWATFSAPLRSEAVGLLSGRRDWAMTMLEAVGRKEIPRTDLNDHTILRLRAHRDGRLDDMVNKVWGRVRSTTPAELAALIEAMRGAVVRGSCSFERGRMVFENQCSKCHRFEGKGFDVGPNLDGAARDIDYLLVNILDPNRVIGQPYFTRVVALKNGRVETGILAAEDERSVTIKGENSSLKVLNRTDIEEMVVQEKSLMPEGLDKNLNEQDFRDLIRYVMANPFITEAAVAGPYPAGQQPKVNHASPLSSQGMIWQKKNVGPAGRLPLPAAMGSSQQVAFLAATIHCPQAMATRLLVGADSTIAVWHNGKLIKEELVLTGPALPDQAAFDIGLAAGTNHLLFRVNLAGKSPAFFARVLDPNRKLKYPAMSE